MKKTISVLLAILLVMSVALMPVLAEGGSPTGQYDPKLTWLAEKDSAPSIIKDNLEYAESVAPSTLNGYDYWNIFDYSLLKKGTDGSQGDHYDHSTAVSITISVDAGYDYLIRHYKADETTEDKTFSNPGSSITFTSTCSAFAVYRKQASTSGGGGSPATGDNSAYFVLMAVVFAALAVVFVKKAVKNN